MKKTGIYAPTIVLPNVRIRPARKMFLQIGFLLISVREDMNDPRPLFSYFGFSVSILISLGSNWIFLGYLSATSPSNTPTMPVAPIET